MNVSRTFSGKTQNWRAGQFSIPMHICRELRIGDRDWVTLTIKRPDGTVVLENHKHQLRSGPEIYGPEIRAVLGKEEIIVVTVSTEP